MALKIRHKRAIRLLIDKNLPTSEVADMLDISESTLKDWLKRSDFQEELEKRCAFIDNAEADFRILRAKSVLTTLWNELERRLANSDRLNKIPFRQVMKAITMCQHELRLDTPGEVTAKTGSYDLGNIKERYKNSKSVKLVQKGELDNVIDFPKAKNDKH